MMGKIIPELLESIKSFLLTANKPIIVVLGSTASGKTKISLTIAKAIGAEIISVDSRQLYKEMEIGTDALLPADQDGVPHHMIGILDPNAYFSLADYKYRATAIIGEIYKRRKIPMLVGGTGLYINAIIEDYKIPQFEPNFELRTKLEEEFKQFGAEHLHKQLAELDPKTAANIHPNNVRYVIRALEINHETQAQKKDQKGSKVHDVFYVGLDWPREKLYERINMRVDKQFERGLLDEVKKLKDKISNPKAPAFSSLGCKEVIEYLEGHISENEARELIKKNTRNYAKRQLTWFRKNKDILWLNGQETENELANY